MEDDDVRRHQNSYCHQKTADRMWYRKKIDKQKGLQIKINFLWEFHN